MSNGFDYFGNPLPAQPPAGDSPYASLNAFAPNPYAPNSFGAGIYAPNAYAPSAHAPTSFGSPPPTATPTTRARSSRRPLVVVVLVMVAAAAAAGIAVTRQPHHIALPSTLAGLPKADLHSVASEISSTKKKLAQSGIHDASVALYGGDGSGDLLVIAGHLSSTAPDFGQLASAMTTSTQIAGITITPSVLTSGSNSFECQTIAVAAKSVGVCEWQTPNTILFAVGQGLNTRDTAGALDDVIGADQLH